MSELSVTGERVIEDEYRLTEAGLAIYLLHIAAYRFALPYVQSSRVLDLGCGSGYGSALIADSALHVTAVDVSEQALQYAATHHPKPNLTHLPITTGRPLPFDDCNFDVVLSFQVIEHVHDDEQYVSEARRVLRPGGVFLVVTPNRSVRLFPGQLPWNRWHVREYDAGSLAGLLRRREFAVEMRYMTATHKLSSLEFKRYRRLKWATLPFTLPKLPDAVRVRGLSILQAFNRRAKPTVEPAAHFSEDDVAIGPVADGALNLVAIAAKQG